MHANQMTNVVRFKSASKLTQSYARQRNNVPLCALIRLPSPPFLIPSFLSVPFIPCSVPSGLELEQLSSASTYSHRHTHARTHALVQVSIHHPD